MQSEKPTEDRFTLSSVRKWSLRDFAIVVARMRETQRHYFQTRSLDSLELSKKLERKVDHGLRDVFELEGDYEGKY